MDKDTLEKLICSYMSKRGENARICSTSPTREYQLCSRTAPLLARTDILRFVYEHQKWRGERVKNESS